MNIQSKRRKVGEKAETKVETEVELEVEVKVGVPAPVVVVVTKVRTTKPPNARFQPHQILVIQVCVLLLPVVTFAVVVGQVTMSVSVAVLGREVPGSVQMWHNTIPFLSVSSTIV